MKKRKTMHKKMPRNWRQKLIKILKVWKRCGCTRKDCSSLYSKRVWWLKNQICRNQSVIKVFKSVVFRRSWLQFFCSSSSFIGLLTPKNCFDLNCYFCLVYCVFSSILLFRLNNVWVHEKRGNFQVYIVLKRFLFVGSIRNERKKLIRQWNQNMKRSKS